MTGVQKWWYEDGQLATSGAFDLGKPNGEWNWYHRNGQKAVMGTYERGATIGTWTWWSVNGKLTRKDASDAIAISEAGPQPVAPGDLEPRLASPRQNAIANPRNTTDARACHGTTWAGNTANVCNRNVP
jgi:hypothetical protein